MSESTRGAAAEVTTRPVGRATPHALRMGEALQVMWSRRDDARRVAEVRRFAEVLAGLATDGCGS